MRTLRSTALIVLLVAFLAGCAGGRGTVRFDSVKYPVSMSGYVYGPKQQALSPKSLKVVGEFSHSMRMWGVLFSLVPITGSVDVSDAINDAIAEHRGDGVINLKIRSEGCAVNYFPALSLMPIWPGCADVTIEGQVVKRRSSKRRTARRR